MEEKSKEAVALAEDAVVPATEAEERIAAIRREMAELSPKELRARLRKGATARTKERLTALGATFEDGRALTLGDWKARAEKRQKQIEHWISTHPGRDSKALQNELIRCELVEDFVTLGLKPHYATCHLRSDKGWIKLLAEIGEVGA